MGLSTTYTKVEIDYLLQELQSELAVEGNIDINNLVKGVSGKAVYDYTTQKINTIADLRNTIGKEEGQIVELLGYYQVGDAPVIKYKWLNINVTDDGGKYINIENEGTWEAQFNQQVDVRSYGVYPDNTLSSAKKAERINRIFELGYDVLIAQEGVYFLSSPLAGTELNSIIMPKSNTTLTIMPNVELKLDVNSPTMLITGGVYQIIYIKNITNFKLYGNGSIINGNKAEVSTKTSSGEWGHGIVISGSHLIEINDINCINCWGDGTNISKRDGLDNPSFVTFKNVICDSNRRQGLSITGGRVIRINNSQFLNTNGVDPSAGIDVEPDALEGAVIEDVIFDNIKVLGNRLGVVFYDLQLITEKTNNIKIVNSDIEALLFFSHNIGGVTAGIHNISIRDTKIGSSNSTMTYTFSVVGNVKNINIDNVQVYGGVRGVDMDFSKYNLPDQLCTINISNLKIFDFSNTGINIRRDTNTTVVLKSMINDVFIYSSSYVRAYNITGVTDFSGKNIDWYGSPTGSSLLTATNINTYAVKGVINKSSTDFLFKPTISGRAVFESPNGSITKALNLSDAGRLLIGTDTLIDTSRTATTTISGIVRQSTAVNNVSTAVPTSVSNTTATTLEELKTFINDFVIPAINNTITLSSSIKTAINQKLESDRASGQQTI